MGGEQRVPYSGLEYTILKAGMIYGSGDHMLDYLSHTLDTLTLFATVGFLERPIHPAIEDLVNVLTAALLQGRLSRQTAFVIGPETLLLSEAVQRVLASSAERPGSYRFRYGFTTLFPGSSSAPCAFR